MGDGFESVGMDLHADHGLAIGVRREEPVARRGLIGNAREDDFAGELRGERRIVEQRF